MTMDTPEEVVEVLSEQVTSLVPTITTNITLEEDDKYNILLGTRYMEIIGFTVSLIFLSTSLYVLTCYTVLQNTRNKIHMNLFAAMTIQTLSRLVIYLDQLFNVHYGISHTPVVCVICYAIMEWAVTAMFFWMLVEGMYIRYMISKNILKSFELKYYFWFAWGLTIFFTFAWAFTTSPNHVDDCWYGYNFEASYWIMQAPRFVVIMINMITLVLILKKLCSKLYLGDTEIKKLKTSVRVVAILTPLLGIINILHMVDISIYMATWKFALWIYFSHFLRSFQGCFLSLFYCLFNEEVYQTLKRKLRAIRFRKYFTRNRFPRNCFTRRILPWNWFTRTRPVNNTPQITNQLLSNVLLTNIPPAPFFRINSSGNPTTRLDCGCKPRIDIHESGCPLMNRSPENPTAPTSNRLDSETRIDIHESGCPLMNRSPENPTAPTSNRLDSETRIHIHESSSLMVCSSENPTPTYECGCKITPEDRRRCSLTRHCPIDMEDGSQPFIDDSIPMTTGCMNDSPVPMVVYPEIHAPPPNSQRPEQIEIIEWIETTV